MLTLIWFLGISFVVLTTMVLFRAYEIKKNKLIFSIEFRNKIDRIFLKMFSKSINFYHNQSLKLKNLFQKIKHRIHEKLHLAWRKLSDKVDGYFLRIRGRRNIGKKGSISIYWQQVKKEQEEEG
jgi:hypothetical protein